MNTFPWYTAAPAATESEPDQPAILRAQVSELRDRQLEDLRMENALLRNWVSKPKRMAATA